MIKPIYSIIGQLATGFHTLASLWLSADADPIPRSWFLPPDLARRARDREEPILGADAQRLMLHGLRKRGTE